MRSRQWKNWMVLGEEKKDREAMLGKKVLLSKILDTAYGPLSLPSDKICKTLSWTLILYT